MQRKATVILLYVSAEALSWEKNERTCIALAKTLLPSVALILGHGMRELATLLIPIFPEGERQQLIFFLRKSRHDGPMVRGSIH